MKCTVIYRSICLSRMSKHLPSDTQLARGGEAMESLAKSGHHLSY